MPNIERKMYFKNIVRNFKISQLIFSKQLYIQPPANNGPSIYFESHFSLKCTYICDM